MFSQHHPNRAPAGATMRPTLTPTSLIARGLLGLALLALASQAGAAEPRKHKPTPPPAAAAATPPAPESAFPTTETMAQFAYIMDANTGAVLFDKNGEQRMYPSSMTKMMTAYI